jgi:hypothetical protein
VIIGKEEGRDPMNNNSSEHLRKDRGDYEEMSEDDEDEEMTGNQVMEEGDVKSGRWTDEEHDRFLQALK